MHRLQEIRSKKSVILDLANRYGIERLRLFGSVSRQEDGPDSDIDILVRWGPKGSLLAMVGFKQDLEEVFKSKVDLVTESSLPPMLRQGILDEAIEL